MTEEKKPDEPVPPADERPAEDAADETPAEHAGDVLDELVIEPEGEPVAEAPSPADDADRAEAGGKAEIQPPREPAPLPVESLDTCPNCGSPMRGKDALVCLRCGYDIKQLKVIETETEDRAKPAPRRKEKAKAAEPVEAQERPPLARAGMGGLRLPLILAVLAAAALAIGYLVGYQGLFPAVRAAVQLNMEGGGTAQAVERIEWAQRFNELGRFPVLVALWMICAMGALVTGSWLFGRPLGDAKLAATRMLAILVVARCASFLSFDERIMEFLAEAAAAALLFFLLTMLLFRLKPRDAGSLLALTVVSFIVLHVGAQLMAWAT